jgi:hypothetical protein
VVIRSTLTNVRDGNVVLAQERNDSGQRTADSGSGRSGAGRRVNSGGMANVNVIDPSIYPTPEAARTMTRTKGRSQRSR